MSFTSSVRAAAKGRRSTTYRMCQPALRADRVGIAARPAAFSRAASSAGSSAARQNPAEIATRRGRGALGELLRDGSEGRPPAELLHDAIGAALAFVHILGPIDRHEDLRNAGLGLADIRPHAAQRIVDFSLGDVDLGTDLPSDDLAPGDLGLDLLQRNIGSDADALQIQLELAPRQPCRRARSRR